jgi:multiple sugar transport system permease protein
MRLFASLVRYALLLLWSFICMFPIYWLVIASFKSPEDQFAGPYYVPYVDFQPTLEAWRYILADPRENLLWPFVNSLVTSAAATLIAVLLAGFSVYGVTRFPARTGKLGGDGDHMLFWIMLTRILPPIVLALPIYFMAQMTSTLDTVFSLIFAYAAINLPVAIWMLRPVLGNKATEMEESALLEGASHGRVFFEIVLPVTAAGFAAVTLIVFVLCWNEYLLAAFLTTNNAMTLPPWAIGQLSMKEAQVGGEAEEWAHMAAATVFMMIPVLFIAIYVQRFLRKHSFFKDGK